jgi:hypothetical protein
MVSVPGSRSTLGFDNYGYVMHYHPMAKAPSRRKQPVQFWITPEQHTQLVSLSERSGIPMSRYIREALNMILEREEKVLEAILKARAKGNS